MEEEVFRSARLEETRTQEAVAEIRRGREGYSASRVEARGRAFGIQGPAAGVEKEARGARLEEIWTEETLARGNRGA